MALPAGGSGGFSAWAAWLVITAGLLATLGTTCITRLGWEEALASGRAWRGNPPPCLTPPPLPPLTLVPACLWVLVDCACPDPPHSLALVPACMCGRW